MFDNTLIIFRLLSVLLLINIVTVSRPACLWATDPASMCPGQAADPVHRKTMTEFAYRMTPQIEEYGCDVVLTYTAFGNDHCVLLELAEEQPELMEKITETLAATPQLALMLHKFPKLTQALDLRLRDESTQEEFWNILESMGKTQVQAIMKGKPNIALLTLLLPNASPQALEKNFSKRQQELLVYLINMTALTSSFAIDVEGMETLLPYMTTNPTDALKIYKLVLNEWGEEGFSRLLGRTPEAVSSTVPPLTLQELSNLQPLSSDTNRFQTMQKEYIPLVRNLYQNIARRYGEAWASEFISGFADVLPLALLTRDDRAAAKIQRLLVDLANSDFFSKILMPGACDGDSTNLNQFSRLLAWFATTNQDANTKTHALTALASWHENGGLMPIVQRWVSCTTPKNFRQNLQYVLEPSPEAKEEKMPVDAAFWIALTRLALIRADLLPEQQALLDKLAMHLMRPDVHPAITLNFLVVNSQPLFNVLQPGKFKQPEAVALRLLTAGYPESSDSSIYESFCKNEDKGSMPASGRAIQHRGSLPEGELLRHGRTFADDHGGWNAWEMVEAVDTTLTIGGALVFTVVTYGAGTPVLVTAATKVGLKQAARQTAKVAVRALARGAKLIPRTVRPIVIKGAKFAYKGVKGYYSPDYGAKSLGGKIFNVANNTYQVFDTLNKIRSFLTPETGEAPVTLPEPVTICPNKTSGE